MVRGAGAGAWCWRLALVLVPGAGCWCRCLVLVPGAGGWCWCWCWRLALVPGAGGWRWCLVLAAGAGAGAWCWRLALVLVPGAGGWRWCLVLAAGAGAGAWCWRLALVPGASVTALVPVLVLPSPTGQHPTTSPSYGNGAGSDGGGGRDLTVGQGRGGTTGWSLGAAAALGDEQGPWGFQASGTETGGEVRAGVRVRAVWREQVNGAVSLATPATSATPFTADAKSTGGGVGCGQDARTGCGRGVV
ncbi:unnamed protein product [Closterium sp. NIES-64]|nr:unnamed protein product [Closterium sp. NIES-64]